MRILVAPLNWGLGHATRCIPIIKYLLSQKHEVIIASDGAALALLKEEFPKVNCIALPTWNVHYTIKPFFLGMLLQLPAIIKKIKEEERLTKAICKQNHIDCIISDNRYGIYNNVIPSVLICHQINLQFPFLLRWVGGIFNFFYHRDLKKYNQIWIPDIENGITGKLSSNKFNNTRYIGLLCRWNQNEIQELSISRTILFLLSGPEPSRTEFENSIIKQLNNLKESEVKLELIRGTKSKQKIESTNKNLAVYHTLPQTLLEEKLKKSNIVICRSGYTSIMDILALGKRVVFVPTPGQTEQEYLAQQLKSNYQTSIVEQSSFNLLSILKNVDSIKSISAHPNHFNQFQIQIENWLNEVKRNIPNLRGHD